MFQNFDDIGGPAHGAERARILRSELQDLSLSGLILPRADEYQNEMVSPDAEQLLWLTGFSGSWGTAIVLEDKAGLVIDGRYTLQAAAQVDCDIYEVVDINKRTMAEWLGQNLKTGDRLGYDARLHTVSQVEALKKTAAKAGAELIAVDPNPLAKLWTDRPVEAPKPIEIHDIAFAGVEAREKIANIQDKLATAGRDAVVLGPLDSIAWLFNIRGQDLPHTPFVLSHAFVPSQGKARLFVDPRKVPDDVRAALSDVADIAAPQALKAELAALGEAGARVQLDPETVSQWCWNQLAATGAAIEKAPDPCKLPKAKKNAAEIAGTRSAHLRDAAAMTRFLAWFDAEAPAGGLDEVGVAKKLESFRRESNLLRDISFDTIAGSGPNGAIVHYRPSEASNRAIEPGSLFLIDSGGQYRDGTTDITRTLPVGDVTPEMRRHYTLVLKGHIAISRARFPKNTRGTHLDALARLPLWEAGLDFDHGVGHGVGSFLSVHEGPQGISRRQSVPLEPGMIVSNEPGFYREGAYGIRIENLVLVTEPEEIPGGERPMMGFETLTLAPYARRLIDLPLLREDEIAWIDAYHERVFNALNEALDEETRSWLRNATRTLRA